MIAVSLCLIGMLCSWLRALWLDMGPSDGTDDEWIGALGAGRLLLGAGRLLAAAPLDECLSAPDDF